MDFLASEHSIRPKKRDSTKSDMSVSQNENNTLC